MALTIVTAPTVEPVTLTEAREHLRIDAPDEDPLIISFIEAATDYCEDLQNRAYIDQTWDLTLDIFPNGDIINIPLPPLQSVSSVTYYGTGGTANTLTSSTYIVDTNSEPGRLSLAYNAVWPNETLRPVNGVVVRFVAGYGSVATAVPNMAKQAVKLMVGHMFEHRENAEIKKLEKIPDGVFDLLAFERIWPI